MMLIVCSALRFFYLSCEEEEKTSVDTRDYVERIGLLMNGGRSRERGAHWKGGCDVCRDLSTRCVSA